MDFEFDEDQLHLRSSVAEVLAKECPPPYLRAVLGGDADPRALWDTLVGLDWPGLAIPEELGGVGLSAVESAIVLEQLGYVGDPTPFLSTTSQFAPVVATCGDDEQRRRYLGAVARGGTGTLALAGDDGRWDPTTPPVVATRGASGWTLQGTASFVTDGARADEIAVMTRSDEGPAVLVVPGTEVTSHPVATFDPTMPVAHVTFDGATVEDDRRLRGGDPVAGTTGALDTAITALAMTMVGACQRGLDMVLEYVKGREQFGVPVGSFQAVKHKAVDLYVAIERARALAQFAALTIAEGDPRQPLAASMAKAAAGDAQRIAFEHTIQLHGGIGFTWENDVHLYLRRAKAGELLLGGAAEHRRRVARLTLAGLASDGRTDREGS